MSVVEKEHPGFTVGEINVPKFTYFEHIASGEKFMRHVDVIAIANGRSLNHARDLWTTLASENQGLAGTRDVEECADVQDWVFRKKRVGHGGHAIVLLSAEAAMFVLGKVVVKAKREGARAELAAFIQTWKGTRKGERAGKNTRLGKDDPDAIAEQVVTRVVAALDEEFKDVMASGVLELRRTCRLTGMDIARMGVINNELMDTLAEAEAGAGRVLALARGVPGAEALVKEAEGLQNGLMERKRKAVFVPAE